MRSIAPRASWCSPSRSYSRNLKLVDPRLATSTFMVRSFEPPVSRHDSGNKQLDEPIAGPGNHLGGDEFADGRSRLGPGIHRPRHAAGITFDNQR
ncbi:MAG: hypothetical protein Ct9H300mP1_03970 [Planctomycetaceae bacterium]|nr:MAG: hypothetical protein Ct9H300mP1_03970 [Planctomycetaceae bacterium]